MATDRLACLALVLVCGLGHARDLSGLNPPFPRIGNCYGAGLGWRTWEQGAEYWSKLDLFVGGGYDLHYDWDNPRWDKTLQTLAANIQRLRQTNPNALVLPYVDVIEGVENPATPAHWWDLNAQGQRWSGWPGMYRINMKLPEVLQYNLDMARERVLAREMFDGIFYDCWSPDDWLCPRTAQLRDGKAVVMLNAWNLPTRGFADLNGVLSEDELNRVVAGKVDFDDFMRRYLRWCRESRKPVVTMIVCHPEGIDDDPWRWSKLPRAERQQIGERMRTDEQTMRFGLTATLMGDGYFGYDLGTMGRGNWWWYKEYDAPLGSPRGDCRRDADGTYQREFDGGTVVTNGSPYDAVVRLPGQRRDMSTGRVSTTFTIPMYDGRIFLPTQEPETTTPDVAPRLTASPPTQLRLARLPGDNIVVQTPQSLDLRFDGRGELRKIMWRGQTIMTGGFPVVATPPFRLFAVQQVTAESPEPTPGGPVKLLYRGSFVSEEQRADFVETVTVQPDGRFTLRFDSTAASDLNIRMWRHYFAFPTRLYAGATAEADGKSLVLPEALGQDQLLPPTKRFVLKGQAATIAVDSALPLTLVDHRKYGTDEYLLAGYPVGGTVKQGAQWSVEMTVAIADVK
ncbi:putative glycoside hydrolase family 15 protein [bacterium]|nr:putative glycoside hydrolase family 15 protein [bacterium]